MHDHGRSENGLLYMVFEFIDGVPLSKLVRARGALDPRRVIKIMRQSLSSLQEAHAMGMLHRDIKPGNIMVYEHVGRADQVKVLDFGIAKVVGKRVTADLKEDLTTNGALLGTPRYMSPEQIRGQDLTPASDIYSLGLVAFEMLTGNKAIDSNSSVIVIGAQLDPRSFALPRGDTIPGNLRAVINRMLAKETSKRYQTVDEVLADLDRLDTGAFPAAAASLPVSAQSGSFQAVDDVPDISDSIEPLVVAEADEAIQVKKRNQGALIAAGGIALLLAAIILMVVVGGDDPPADDAVEPNGDETVVVKDPISDETTDGKDEADEQDQVAVAVKDVKTTPPDPKVDRPKEMQIVTNPPGLEVFVNGKSFGPSPAAVSTNGLSFPAKIRAQTESGNDRFTVIDSAMAEVELDLSMYVVAKQPTKTEPDRRRDPVKTNHTRKKPDTTKKPPKEEPADDTESTGEDEEEKKGGFTLPALDNL